MMKGKPKEFSKMSYRIIGCAMEVHRVLGHGLLESMYPPCLAPEFEINKIFFKTEHPLPGV